jgi:hypothetical protein
VRLYPSSSRIPGQYAKVTLKSQYTNGTAFSGIHTVLKDASDNTLSRGFTQSTIGMPINQNLTLLWNNFGTKTYQNSAITVSDSSQFTEWSDTIFDWGGKQKIKLFTQRGNYTDTGKYSP